MYIESKRNIAKYIFAFGSVQGLNIAIGIVRTKLVALLLGPNGMGILTLYNSAVTMVQNATNLGLDKSSVPVMSQAYDSGNTQLLGTTIRSVRSMIVLAALMALAAGVVFSWLLSVVAFGDASRTLHFVMLSPVAPLMILLGGELMIMKATRQLRLVAMLSLCSMLLMLVISVPMFYVWSAHAIIPSLVLTSLVQCVVIMAYSYKRYPLELSINRRTISQSKPTIKLGIAFVVASTITTGAEFLVRAYLNNVGTDSIVGLYNVGCMIPLVYGGMIFASIDSEYYPRLCQMVGGDDDALLRSTIRRQIRVALTFIVPMSLVLWLVLPWIVPLLFSNDFSVVVPMSRIALITLVCRAVYLPLGYVPLAKGDSQTFLLLETLSAVFMVTGVVVGYNAAGLIGCGYGLAIAHTIDIVDNIIVCRWRYGRII